jgi:FkbM family methyltransferase
VALEPRTHLARALAARFPEAEVLPLAVSDRIGEAVLHTSSSYHHLATLDESWLKARGEPDGTWDGGEAVEITTVDALIRQYGRPQLIKVDTEGFEDASSPA